jgi:hypothetical protein
MENTMSNGILSHIGGFFGDVARAHGASRLYTELQTMSDAELARHGLTRESIARHVMTRTFNE